MKNNLTGGQTAAIIFVIFLVLAASFAIGVWSKRKNNTAAQFIGASKSFGPLATGLSSTAAMASGWLYVGTVGNVYANGNLMGIFTYLSFCFSLGFMYYGKRIRALAEIEEVSTLGDILNIRYRGTGNTKYLRAFYAIAMFLGCFSYLGAQISAGSGLLKYLFPNWSTFLACAMFFGVVVIYIAIGGESAGLLSQAFQGAVMATCGIVFLVIFFFRIGGFPALSAALETKATVVNDLGVEKTFGPMMMTAFGVDYTGVLSLTYLICPIIGVACQPSALTRAYAVRKPQDIPGASMVSAISQALVALSAMSIAFAMLTLVPTGVIKPVNATDQVTWTYGGAMGFGVQLIAYAGITAGIISSASMYITVGANSLAVDLPAALNIKMDDRKKITVSRCAIVFVGICGILMAALSSETVAIIATLGWGTIMSITLPLFVIGCTWKKANCKGMTAAAFCAMVLNIAGLVASQLLHVKFPKQLPWYMWVIMIDVVVGVFGSLLTAKKDQKNEKLVDMALEL